MHIYLITWMLLGLNMSSVVIAHDQISAMSLILMNEKPSEISNRKVTELGKARAIYDKEEIVLETVQKD